MSSLLFDLTLPILLLFVVFPSRDAPRPPSTTAAVSQPLITSVPASSALADSESHSSSFDAGAETNPPPYPRVQGDASSSSLPRNLRDYGSVFREYQSPEAAGIVADRVYTPFYRLEAAGDASSSRTADDSDSTVVAEASINPPSRFSGIVGDIASSFISFYRRYKKLLVPRDKNLATEEEYSDK